MSFSYYGSYRLRQQEPNEQLREKNPKRHACAFVRPYSETPAVGGSLDLLSQVGTQCERAVIVQFLVTSPAHGIAHSLYLNLSSKFQSFPIYDVRKHELCLPNLAR